MGVLEFCRPQCSRTVIELSDERKERGKQISMAFSSGRPSTQAPCSGLLSSGLVAERGRGGGEGAGGSGFMPGRRRQPVGELRGPTADGRPPVSSRPLRVWGCWVLVVIFSVLCRQFRGRGFVAVLLAKSQPCQQFIQLF